jgi:hypothetical protein
MSHLLAEVLNEIFEYLEDDKPTLYSCILVNRFWCEISVRIYWRNIWNYSTSNFNTLIACLPKESKEILYKNGLIYIITPTLKDPTFNYASFCKVLSINQVNYMVRKLLKNQQQFSSLQSLNKDVHIVEQEIFKMFMNQITSLKRLIFRRPTFIFYPGSKDCLNYLSELSCDSNTSSEYYYQLSQICHNILSLEIDICDCISKGLSDFISVQKNLKNLTIRQTISLKDKVTSLITKVPNTLIKLKLSEYNFISFLYFTKFINLQELELSIFYYYEGFEKMRYVIFPRLQVLKIRQTCPEYDLLIEFLKNNGKNLKELYLCILKGCNDNSLNLAISKFCPYLKILFTGFEGSDLESLKIILNSCRYLESIKIRCGGRFLNEKEILEAVVKYSQNITEIILHHVFILKTELLPEELESFFISWTNRIPQKSLSLVIVKYKTSNSLDTNDENMEIIKKYIKLGVLKLHVTGYSALYQ